MLAAADVADSVHRAIHFATYGNGKRLLIELNNGQESTLVHLGAAISAGGSACQIIVSFLTIRSLRHHDSHGHKPNLDGQDSDAAPGTRRNRSEKVQERV